MNADGSGKTQLTNNSFNDAHPSFTPDGQHIVFDSTRADSAGDIFVMNADGTNPVNITVPYAGHSPSVSPDGKRVVFTGTDDRLYLIDIDGTDIELLTLTAPTTSASWGPGASRRARAAGRRSRAPPATMS